VSGDHLARAREAANNGAVTCSAAHALIDIAETLRQLVAGVGAVDIVETVVANHAFL
jgi:hypothetical protein